MWPTLPRCLDCRGGLGGLDGLDGIDSLDVPDLVYGLYGLDVPDVPVGDVAVPDELPLRDVLHEVNVLGAHLPPAGGLQDANAGCGVRKQREGGRGGGGRRWQG